MRVQWKQGINCSWLQIKETLSNRIPNAFLSMDFQLMSLYLQLDVVRENNRKALPNKQERHFHRRHDYDVQ